MVKGIGGLEIPLLRPQCYLSDFKRITKLLSNTIASFFKWK